MRDTIGFDITLFINLFFVSRDYILRDSLQLFGSEEDLALKKRIRIGGKRGVSIY